MLVSVVALGVLGMGGAFAAGCTAGATTTTSSPSASSSSTADGGSIDPTTGPASVDFYMAASQCLTPCPMGSPVLQGASVTIQAVIENADSTEQYSFRVGDDQNASWDSGFQLCYCGSSTTTVDCATTCDSGQKKLTVVSANIGSDDIENLSFTVVDQESNVIGSSSFNIEAPAGMTTGVTNALQKVVAGADGAFTVPAGAAVEITYTPVDASGTPLYFSQGAVSATFSSPDIVGPTTVADESTPDAALGTGNVLFAAAGNTGDASISIATAGVYNSATQTVGTGVQSTVNFHVAAP